MTSDSSFASLSPMLLARKGGAKPAMRPQHARLQPTNAPAAGEQLEDLGWDDMGDHSEQQSNSEVINLTPPPVNQQSVREAAEQDRNAEAELHPAATPPVHQQRDEIAQRLQTPAAEAKAPEAPLEAPVQEPVQAPAVATAPQAAPKPAPASTRRRRPALDRGKRAAFTLRLDAERHLKLRLACTVSNSSAQQLVTKALDDLLSEMPEINALAAQVQRD